MVPILYPTCACTHTESRASPYIPSAARFIIAQQKGALMRIYSASYNYIDTMAMQFKVYTFMSSAIVNTEGWASTCYAVHIQFTAPWAVTSCVTYQAVVR